MLPGIPHEIDHNFANNEEKFSRNDTTTQIPNDRSKNCPKTNTTPVLRRQHTTVNCCAEAESFRLPFRENPKTQSPSERHTTMIVVVVGVAPTRRITDSNYLKKIVSFQLFLPIKKSNNCTNQPLTNIGKNAVSLSHPPTSARSRVRVVSLRHLQNSETVAVAWRRDWRSVRLSFTRSIGWMDSWITRAAHIVVQ